MDIITLNLEKKIKEEGPLAQRMRPENLDQFIGQDTILGEGKTLRTLIDRDKIVSLIFYGPPGTGKTSLARIIASGTKAVFIQLNAVASGVKDVRQVIEEARDNWSLHSKRTILFIDEIHRFNKAQQDVLLSAVEQGTVVFIGATTENPFFYLTGPLLSRTRLFLFETLKNEDIMKLLQSALKDEQRGLGRLKIEIETSTLKYIAERSEGDARSALNTLEIAVLAAEKTDDKVAITLKAATEAMQKKLLLYDQQGDNHYDMASALIKSIRGSDPDAALYWMARMIAGGEDPLFIARRLIISAAEDVGNADPQALPLAVAAAEAVKMIGLPEGRIPLAQAATYLAGVPKSNASYLAINRAFDLVEKERNHPVPKHLKDSSYQGAGRLGHGKDYRYPHDYPGHYLEQDYLPSTLQGIKFYNPTEQGREKEIALYLDRIGREASQNKDQARKE